MDSEQQSNDRLPFFITLDRTAQKIWPGFTLIIPICAVGNVAQLTCDLMISTFLKRGECQLVGRIYSPALMPFIGPNAFEIDGFPTSSTEVYMSEKHKLIIIQQRTSYYKPLKKLYIKDLVNWIKNSQFDQVLVLTSSFAQCNPDTSRLGYNIPTASSIYYMCTSASDDKVRIWPNFGLKEVQNKDDLKVLKDGLSFLPGSGLTKPLHKAFEKESIPASIIVSFCSEGINLRESYEMAHLIGKYIGLQILKTTNSGDCDSETSSFWVEPFSWNLILETPKPDYY